MKLFSIGEMAKLFHLSISSIRHYEKLGLVCPEEVSPDSGYRYYSVRQFEVFNTILYLRALGISLNEIADFLQDRDVDRIEKKLQQQKEAVSEKRRELARIERKIDNRLRRLNDAQTAQLDVIRMEKQPGCRLVWMEDSLKIRNYHDMEEPITRLAEEQAEAVIFLGKVGVGISAEHLQQGAFSQYDGVFLILDEEDRYGGETRIMPETSCVRICFRGSHERAPAQYEKLMRYIRENALKVSGFSREITLIDYGITRDTQKFVTEISIPVER